MKSVWNGAGTSGHSKNTYREIYRVPGCGRGYEVTEAWGCNIQGKYVQLWFSQGYSGFHLYRITGYGNLSCCIWIRICDGRRFCSLSDHRNCWKPVSFKTCEYFDSLECKSPAIPAHLLAVGFFIDVSLTGRVTLFNMVV